MSNELCAQMCVVTDDASAFICAQVSVVSDDASSFICVHGTQPENE